MEDRGLRRWAHARGAPGLIGYHRLVVQRYSSVGALKFHCTPDPRRSHATPLDEDDDEGRETDLEAAAAKARSDGYLEV